MIVRSHGRGRLRAWQVAVVSSTLAMSLFVAAPRAASAGEVDYCNKLIASGSLCREGANRHSYWFNQAAYFGNGYLGICQKVVKWNEHRVTGTTYSYTCDYGWVTAATFSVGDLAYPYVQQHSGYNHTIDGWARW